MCALDRTKALLGELFLQLICEPGFPEEKAHISSFIPTANSTLKCFGDEWLRGADRKQLEVSSLVVFSSSPARGLSYLVGTRFPAEEPCLSIWCTATLGLAMVSFLLQIP